VQLPPLVPRLHQQQLLLVSLEQQQASFPELPLPQLRPELLCLLLPLHPLLLELLPESSQEPPRLLLRLEQH